MKSYRQFCGVAKALDIIGDRWTLLIVRELLIREHARYTDLRDGLPGIASNLLAERLRELEGAGVIDRDTSPAPIAVTLFRLTDRGRALEPVIHQIGVWGGALIGKRSAHDAFRSHWMALPLRMHLQDNFPDEPPVSIELRCGESPLVIEAAGTLNVREGAADNPDLTLTGRPDLVIAVMTRRMSTRHALAAGLKHSGSLATLRRVIPPQPSQRTSRAREVSGR